MSVVGYPTPGKEKAKLLLDAFCGGAGGTVVSRLPDKLLPGAAAFYGVVPETKHLWEQAKAEGRDYYYIDNAYFDPCRERYFRIAKNRLQHDGGMDETDGKRWAALGLSLAPWRESGKHILVCPQSDQFMRDAVGYPGSWLKDITHALRVYTEREVRVRPWDGNKAKWYQSLPADLVGAHALVTYSSASAISALLAGVPAFCTATDCIASSITRGDISNIEYPVFPEYRERWAMVVADNQWTVREMKEGLPWRWMNPRIDKSGIHRG